jgi:hypothetical protein
MEINIKEKIVCENCHFIMRPFGRSLNDSVYCSKLLKFVESILKHSYENWKEWQPNDVFI